MVLLGVEKKWIPLFCQLFLFLVLCFSGFWPRRQEGGPSTPSWLIGGLNQPPSPQILENPYHLPAENTHYFQEIVYKTKDMDNVDLRDVVRQKALKHRCFYDSMLKHAVQLDNTSTDRTEMAPYVATGSNNTAFTVSDIITKEIPAHVFLSTTEGTGSNTNSEGVSGRQRKRAVYEKPSPTVDDERNETETANTIEFKSVKQLREHYQAMLEKTYKTLSLKEDGREKSSDLLVPPSSGYCSSAASGTSDDEKEKSFGCRFQKESLRRSASSDSAVLSDEEGIIGTNWGEKKEEIAANEVFPRSPYSPRGSIDHSNVPSKLLLESKFVALPVDRKFSVDCVSDLYPRSVSDSRRESCFSEGDEHSRYRYWRTPSVVVSDYSDDIMGLTLEDIEYIRNKRENSYSPCSSVHSSCSNLNYCGSTISVVEGDYVMCKPYRKNSNCSTCSTLSDEEDNVPESVPERTLLPQRTKEPSGWRKLRNIVQWTPFFQTYKKQRYPWVQLAGHQGNFKAGPDQGTILKKLCAKEEKCFKILMKDILRPYVPEYKGLVTSDDGECSYIQLQDLLGDFVSPCVMDCKIGVRTYLEEELAKAKEKPKLRKDMYEKMCQIDTTAPNEEEHRLKGVTKPRYMVWRETISSTATLGFRIEGIRGADGTSSKDFKTTKTKDQVIATFEKFTDGFPHAIPKYIQRLKAIKATLESSSFFNSHEMIGSSLLFVHDRYNASVWLIDFAKTVILPEEIQIDHRSKWKVGNHEDGYMIGVNNLIKIFMTMLENQPVTITPPLSLQEPQDVAVPEKNKENEDRNDNT